MFCVRSVYQQNHLYIYKSKRKVKICIHVRLYVKLYLNYGNREFKNPYHFAILNVI